LLGKGRTFNLTKPLEMLQALVGELNLQGHFAELICVDAEHVKEQLRQTAIAGWVLSLLAALLCFMLRLPRLQFVCASFLFNCASFRSTAIPHLFEIQFDDEPPHKYTLPLAPGARDERRNDIMEMAGCSGWVVVVVWWWESLRVLSSCRNLLVVRAPAAVPSPQRWDMPSPGLSA
jgi:hypothetical protein